MNTTSMTLKNSFHQKIIYIINKLTWLFDFYSSSEICIFSRLESRSSLQQSNTSTQLEKETFSGTKIVMSVSSYRKKLQQVSFYKLSQRTSSSPSLEIFEIFG